MVETRRAAPVAAAPVAPAPAMPGPVDGSAFALLAFMVFLAPAVGVPGELMLQDTLKSLIVAFCTLGAALQFFLAQRQRTQPLHWHAVLWLPLLLMAYALGSMAWSHPYLGGVEAVRWFIFALIAWLGLNLLTRERMRALAWCIHGGALVASLWTVLQFWTGFSLFPQGPQPASTFINRNFFAEFVVCTLPFAFLLLANATRPARALALAASSGFIVVAILMTGTRAALAAMWLQLLVVLPVIAWRCRGRLAWAAWTPRLRGLAAATFMGTVLALGLIPSGNPKIVEEGHGSSPLLRGFTRTQSIGPRDASLNLRLVMWRDTLRAIQARPLAGLGAGAWESEIPLYQEAGEQLETDYYAHNEFLQMMAEYGLVGWLFLLLLTAYLLNAAWRSWRGTTPADDEERALRAVLLSSLLALMIVSNAGFPWRLAATGALFALCLGGLAASDARLAFTGWLRASPLRWSPAVAATGLAATGACLALAIVIAQRAAESERKLVQAARYAVSISASGDPLNPRFDPWKREMLALAAEGIALNPHYRKITPMVADELARWGDWANATWIWESVLASRPNVVAIISNAARGYSALGQQDRAMAYLERARRIQPQAPAVRSLEVILLARGDQPQLAMQRAQQAMDDGVGDYDLVNAYFILAWRGKDYPLAFRVLEQRMARWPQSRPRGLLQLGLIHAGELKEPAKALEFFRRALAEAPPGERAQLLPQVPAEYRAQLGAAGPTPQTSANSR